MSIAVPLSVNGRYIVDAKGNRVRLAGVNWFGAHEDLGVVTGLHRVHRRSLAEYIASLGFNSVRFPFSLSMLSQTTAVPDYTLAANTDLYGKTPLEVFDACVEALTGAGLIVIPNCHLLDRGWCCSNDDQNGLWFNDAWTAAQFTAGWQAITTRYKSNRLVAAMDIKNEPRQATLNGTTLTPSWGTGASTDFMAMYTATGDAIHKIDPDVLIICEGLAYGGDLTPVAEHPVTLSQPGKVVYSMHDYPWYHAANQAESAYLSQMEKAGGYLLTNQIAPVWLGEFGIDEGGMANFALGPTSQAGTAQTGVWWTNIYNWLTQTDGDWCWWGLNPEHPKGTTPNTGQLQFNWGDRAGESVLSADWTGVANPAVLELLQAIMPAHEGPGVKVPPATGKPSAGGQRAGQRAGQQGDAQAPAEPQPAGTSPDDTPPPVSQGI
ncbi:MAG TPA: cellulase family glycosylhydrolase [Streptosporangiaceae bacterium]